MFSYLLLTIPVLEPGMSHKNKVLSKLTAYEVIFICIVLFSEILDKKMRKKMTRMYSIIELVSNT